MSDNIEYADMVPADLSDYDTLSEVLEEDNGRAWDDKVEHALAESKITEGDDMWDRFCSTILTELEGVRGGNYQSTIKGVASKLERERSTNCDQERGPPTVPEPDEPVLWDTVEECVRRNYDQRMLDVVEALCANTLVLSFTNIDNAPMLIIEGASGAGKSTGINFMEGASDELLIRADSITSPAFNSHSSDQEVHGENDLLPEIRHRVLSVSELSKLFSGDVDKVKEFWSTMASVADGDGYVKATGSQGRRGYEGDYMFAFQGATTPLPPVAWNAMGTIGGRVLFHEVVGEYDEAAIRDEFWDHDKEPAQRKSECRQIVSEFLRTKWHEAGGYGGIDWRDTDNWEPDDDVQHAIVKLAHLTAIARTPITTGDSGDWEPQTVEVYHRLRDQFVNLARARALMHGRRRVKMDDMGLIARVALSSMPKRRRPYIRWLLDPDTATERESGFASDDGRASVSDVVEYISGISRDTVLTHLKLLDRLDLLTLTDVGGENETRWLIKKHISGTQEWTEDIENTRFDHVWSIGVPFPEAYFVERDN